MLIKEYYGRNNPTMVYCRNVWGSCISLLIRTTFVTRLNCFQLRDLIRLQSCYRSYVLEKQSPVLKINNFDDYIVVRSQPKILNFSFLQGLIWLPYLLHRSQILSHLGNHWQVFWLHQSVQWIIGQRLCIANHIPYMLTKTRRNGMKIWITNLSSISNTF